MSDAALAPERTNHAPVATDASFDREREGIHRQVLSSVSHDLKTPLASIIGSLEIYARMKDKLPPEKQAALIKVALQEAYRLDIFITNILDMAKLENGLIKPRRETVEIGTMLQNCLTRMDHQLEEGGVDIEAKSGPFKTVTDDVLLSRAICLVLDNAVKYGGAPPAIRIEFGRNENQSGYVRIADKGPGIPSSQIESIFSKYTRFSKEDQQNAGTGLGLAIAAGIMKLLGGSIAAANPAAGGALFTLHFPLQQ